ncbi:hypothetical protein BDR03DRAFT_952956, partial [Suillus americanus]
MIDWVGFSAFYLTTVENKMLYALVLTVQRQNMVKVFALLLVITNWILSVTILWLTVLVLFQANINDNLILISTADFLHSHRSGPVYFNSPLLAITVPLSASSQS